jgi:photosystem II stability/assembly factor-like uncharacterized protein
MYKPKSSQLIAVSFFFLLSIQVLYSQSGWFDLNLPGTYMCMYFISDQTGWAAGDGGKILKTTNGGANWTEQAVFPDYELYSIQFPNSLTGYIAGTHCCGFPSPILKTTNSGFNWNEQTSNVTSRLTSVFFTSPNTGWAVGDSGVIVHTTNGGSNWLVVPYPYHVPFSCVQFVNSLTGWIVGGSTVLKTTNGGANWKTPVPSIQNSLYLEARFPISSTGYLVGGEILSGRGFVLKSTNGGGSWDSLISASHYFLYLSFINENTGWICGMDGNIMRTTNGGNNWDSQSIGQPWAWLHSIQFINSSTGWVTGSNSIFKTTTGGVIGITPISGEVPKFYHLSQNYPNPFNPSTIIEFSLPKNANVKIILFDVLGREVRTLANQFMKAGSYKLELNGSSLTSGVYFYRLQAGEFNQTKKMVLVK